MLKEAIEEFQKALKYDPENANAQKYLKATQEKVLYRLSFLLI
jgi:hypothetical protein